MSGELDAAGAMATAGLVAGAIEGREAHEGAGGPCLNCGAQLTGRYCANCGQAAHPHRTLAHVFEEFLHGVLHFDTKAWRTLPMVIGRPGTLTRNYIYGQRARYISPLALFLFCVFFMFFVFAFNPVRMDSAIQTDRDATVAQLADATTRLGDAREALAEIQAERAAAADPERGAGVETMTRQAVALAQVEVNRLQGEIARIDATATSPDGAPAAPSAPAEPDAHPEGAAAPAPTTWQETVQSEARAGNFHTETGIPALDARIEHAAENPDLTLYKMQQAAYKFSFLLVPITLPFIALLFLWKRGLTLYDHVVYALYALCFASLVFVGIVLASNVSWTEWVVVPLLMVGLPVHTFFHLKGAYALGWWSALWRTLFMLVFALIALGIFALAIILLGVAG